MLSPIYAITPDETLNLAKIEEMIRKYKITILQYRRKITDWNIKLTEGEKLKKLCDDLGVNLIINDDVSLAKTLNCGVHLGKDDADICAARTLLGNDAILGISCYNNIDFALKMQQLGANYVAFGAIFPSITKKNAPKCAINILQNASTTLQIPIVAIGGINFENMEQVLQNGANSVAMISALWNK